MILGVVQVRIGSTRFKKKALKPISGKPLLKIIIDRLLHSKKLDKIVIATTNNIEDKVILNFAKEYGIDSYAGSELDLVDRMFQTAKKFKADAIVRITGDCPLVDPKIVDDIIEIYCNNREIDYVSNIYPPTYPDGLDVELFPFKTLEFLWNNVDDAFLRECLSGYIIKNQDKFKVVNYSYPKDLSSLRWTVDYEEDYEFVLKIFEKLDSSDDIFHMEDILNLLHCEPDLLKINAGHIRNEADLKKEDYREIMWKLIQS